MRRLWARLSLLETLSCKRIYAAIMLTKIEDNGSQQLEPSDREGAMIPVSELFVRYLPGLVAAAGGAAMMARAPREHRITFSVLSTLLGLVCMEAEYWVASGFPWSEVPFFVAAVAITLVGLAIGKLGAAILSVIGFAFFAHVNLRYGAPYLLDYVMPVFYAVLMVLSRREMKWSRPGILSGILPEAIVLMALQGLVIWRTTELGKWGWLAGRPWQ